MKWTGERLVTHVDEYFTYEHLHRYYMATQFVAGRKVLDVACGEGYGAALLAKTAKEVVGVDLSEATVAHAQKTYGAENLHFQKGDVRQMDFEDDVFDVITCFETIEHVLEHGMVVAEMARLLKPEGLLIISTPDANSNHHLASRGRNPFHPKELSKEEFKGLLNQYFSQVNFYYQKTISASLLSSEHPTDQSLVEYQGTFNDFSEHNPRVDAQYFVCLCSQSANFSSPPASLVTYENQIKTLGNKILFRIKNLFR